MKSKKYAIYVKKGFVMMIKTRKKSEIIVTIPEILEELLSECNLRYNVPTKMPIVFHNGSTYDYHFAIEKLAEEFKGDFECLGENTEKYITFSVPLKKEDDGKIIYKLKFIDSYRFMQSPLSNLVDSLSGVYDKECKKYRQIKKN